MNPRLSALRISLLYLVFAALWMVLGDHWLQMVFTEPAQLLRWMIAKKYVFLGISALVV